MTPLRVAFVGAGCMARRHLAIVERLASSIVGVYDRAPGAREEFAALARSRAFSSIDALLDAGRPDVVHVCTPPDSHFEPAYLALDSGAHVYVEKPFALTLEDARALLDLARSRGRLVCAGHQLLKDRAFEALIARGAGLGPLIQVDSHFAFRPAGVSTSHQGARALSVQLIDILPHPLYSLIAAMQRFGPVGTPLTLDWARGGSTDLQAMVRAGEIVGRLSVSLRARPVASFLTLTGAQGSLTCDFIRSTVVGAANPGTEPLEKVLNPIVEGLQLLSRTAIGIGRRVGARTNYPGLSELIGEFYAAVTRGGPSPVPPGHLLDVTRVFEELVAKIEAAVCTPKAPRPRPALCDSRPSIVVTGARGLLGARIARALGGVRGISRTANFDDPYVHEWVVGDLSTGVPPHTLDGARLVIHAAAETAGDYEAHRRNTIDATRHLLHAMHAAGVRRLILVSSLSVLRPPLTPWEHQNERTPRLVNPRSFGPYAWGKTQQEELVEREAATMGIETRIIRPGALVDWRDPSLPGLMGRRLFGRWHLAMGRPGLPIAVCDVERSAQIIAWCTTHFDEAPSVVNLFDPALTTRGSLLGRMHALGWTGRVVWVPISAISLSIMTVRAVQSVLHGRMPPGLAAWSILRPRRFDSRLSARLFAAVEPVCERQDAALHA